MNIEVVRHSLSHILALAVKRIYGDKVKFGTGPATENGFFYDFEFSQPLNKSDFAKIQAEMEKIIKENIPFCKKILTVKKSQTFFKKEEQPYKLHLLKVLAEEGVKSVTHYQLREFEDLCAGPHLKKTGEIKIGSFALTKIAGAYWQGNEQNPMLTRISGLAFTDKKALKKYLAWQEEAKKRDHRKLGKELDLFVFSDLVGPGLPLLTPKGSIIRQELEKFVVEEETRRGYLRTYTPEIAKVDLYKKSGHWDHYREDMYSPINIDGEDYVLRPMTCPHQFMIYNSRPRSYRDLPLRYAELARMYRKEQSGELTGLIRVMGFTLSDAHIICRPDQLEEEFKKVLELVQYSMKILGIKDFWYRFSQWDSNNKEKYIDDKEAWDKSQSSMKKILNKMKLKYEEEKGEAAFYGPKLDIQMRNVNGKEDTAITIQVDFAMPKRFGMVYTDQHGKEQTPMVIHRSSIGCIERTMAFLIEQYAGAFPVWLSPVQVKIISVGKAHAKYCDKLAKEFSDNNIRTEVDNENETVGKKIRQAISEKVPYIIVIGDKEIKSGKLAVRKRDSQKTETIAKKKFVEEIKKKIENKSNE